MTRVLIASAVLGLAACASPAAYADEVVQIPVDSLLDGRPVSTFTGGTVVRWTTGVDQHNGFATSAAAAQLQQSGPALPDDGTFTADATHPELVLHFSNAAAANSGQAHIVPAAGTFEFDVPHATYAKLFLAITSSSGDSALTVTLDYADGSPTTTSFTLPDWGTGKPLPTDPPIFFNLISGLHKWDEQDNSVDTPSHALTGVELSPAATQVLTRVEVSKPNAAQYVVFWGATGIATSVIGGSSGGAGGQAGAGGGGASNGGASGSAGATGGASGTGGVAGAVSSAGNAGSLSSAGGAGSTSIGGQAPSSSSGLGGSRAMAPASTAPESSGCALGVRGAPARGGLALLCALCIGARRCRRRDRPR